MGIPVLIIGNSGSGKSTSMRTLQPDSFGLINVNRKPLPFKSSKKGYDSDDYKKITSAINKWANVDKVCNKIVIDDCQYLMANEYMRRAKETGYQKFTDIGLNFWNLISYCVTLPDDVIVYFLGHSELDQFGNTKFKTIGKMLDEKITVEGMFTIVLRTMKVDKSFYFSTVTDGTDTVKTPMGMFDDQLIDNDLSMVDSTIREYYGLTKGEN